MAPPVVTGVSPKEGIPGTRITIRGENLGKNANDLMGLFICGMDCILSAEWVAPNKIVARSGPVKGCVKGDVIVMTRSGGRGTCTIQFKAVAPKDVGPTKESAIWVDESHIVFHAYGRKRATVTSHMDQDNPLNLSDEGNGRKMPDEEFNEAFPDGSGNLSAENFVPVWFLVENHKNASFQDLQAGLSCLKRKVNSQKEGELSFLKANVSAVLDQLDTLCALQGNILKEKATTGPISTDKMEQAIVESKREADNLFKDVLGRRDRADATRNALGVLQRFKFLYNLPCSIERNIQKGDYDVVINDYARAKSLFLDTEVQSFKKVYQEVEQRIANFRNMLLDRLHDLPMPLDKQIRLIQYLINLEAPGDPAWDSINYHQKFVMQMLENCRDAYCAQDLAYCENLASHLGKGQSTLSASNLSVPTPPSGGRLGRGERRGSNYNRSEAWLDRLPARVQFVEELCGLAIPEFQNLWKIGQSYFSGDLQLKEDTGKTKRFTQFNDMVKEVMRTFCAFIRDALLGVAATTKRKSPWPEATREAAKLWLQQCVLHIRTCYSSVLQMELSMDVIGLIQKLLFDLRMACLRSMLSRSIEEVKNLHSRETWIVDFDFEHGSITQLPLVYENTILKTIQLIREGVLKVGPREIELLGSAEAEREIVDLWRELLLAILQAFQQSVAAVRCRSPGKPRLAAPIDSRARKMSMSDANSNAINNNFTEKSDAASGEVLNGYASHEKLILVVLGNCNYTRCNILPRLFDSFQKHIFSTNEVVIAETVQNFVNLDESLFESYIELKCDPIVGGIEQRMYMGRFDWAKCPRLMGVRPYIQEVLMEIIKVHAETYCVSPSAVSRVIGRIVESVCEEVSRLFSCIEKFSFAGKLQAHFDLLALQLAFHDYLSNSSRLLLKETSDSLPPLVKGRDTEALDKEIEYFRQQMKFQLMCFKVSS